MVKLNFTVNKYLLAYFVINKANLIKNAPNNNLSISKTSQDLRQKLFLKYKNIPYFYFIYLPSLKHLEWAAETIYVNKNNKLIQNSIKILPNEIQKIFKSIFKSAEFKRILKQTLNYKKFVEEEWNQNKSFVFQYLEDIIGKNLPNLSVTVNVIHPSLMVGQAIPEKNLIIWGHFDDWPNYTTVYLTHELLHILFNYYHIKKNNISHALIELITDNELRIRLNKRGKYFKEDKYDIGHPYLRKLEKDILPQWFKYLKTQKKNLILFIKQLNNKQILKKSS